MDYSNSYYIVLDTRAGEQIDDNQANFKWNLDRALPKGSRICLYQFNFHTTSTTSFADLNGVLINLVNIGDKNISYVSKNSDKPVQTTILSCIPNETILSNSGSEKVTGSYEPYNLQKIYLPENMDIYEIELSLRNSDGNQQLTLHDDLEWSVVLQVQI